jgi:Family of unknown function (DUF6879)
METIGPDQWRALFAESSKSAVHLEMRDVYAVEDEKERVARFVDTGTRDLAAEAQAMERSWWLDLMRSSGARGVRLRRARIVSEPVTSYIRYEHAGTPLNIMAGEEVRWLPRTKAARLALPGADFWLFDDQRILFNHFTGDGGWLGNELVTDDLATARLCSRAFEAVWAQATPHDEYHPA